MVQDYTPAGTKTPANGVDRDVAGRTPLGENGMPWRRRPTGGLDLS